MRVDSVAEQDFCMAEVVSLIYSTSAVYFSWSKGILDSGECRD